MHYMTAGKLMCKLLKLAHHKHINAPTAAGGSPEEAGPAEEVPAQRHNWLLGHLQADVALKQPGIVLILLEC
jgi:hypothetical protein